jgi:hypothetical protein
VGFLTANTRHFLKIPNVVLLINRLNLKIISMKKLFQFKDGGALVINKEGQVYYFSAEQVESSKTLKGDALYELSETNKELVDVVEGIKNSFETYVKEVNVRLSNINV